MEPILNFEILPTYDTRIFLVADVSKWEHLENVPTYIDIKVPGATKPSTNFFEKGKINIFNSSLLNLTPATSSSSLVELPDGIYTIKIYPCEGQTFCFERAYLRTIATQLELDQSLIKMNLDSCKIKPCNLEKHLKADELLMSAHANVRDGNLIEGMSNFDAAKEILDEILNCNDCD